MQSLLPMKILASVQDWFFVIISIGHDRTIRLVLELDGRVDMPRLGRALQLLLHAEPVLASRFSPTLFRAYWRHREDVDAREMCQLVETEDVQGALHAFMAVSLDPLKDPLVALRVFRSTADTVCVKLSHAAMDGGGFKQIVQRLTALYRSLKTDPSTVPPLDLATDRSQRQVIRLLSPRARVKAFFTQPFHKKTWSFPFTGKHPADFAFMERTVGVPVPVLREALRARGATIFDGIVASLARTMFDLTDVTPGVPVPFTIATDLRRFLPAPESAGLCNLSSLAWIDLYRKPGATMEETLADVHAAIEATMNDNPGIGLAVVMEVTSILGYHGFAFFNRIRAKMARGQGREFPSLSNIGVMDPRVLDFGDAHVTRARFYGPVIFPPTFYVVSGSFENTLYFTASYPKNVVPEGLMDRLLDRLVEEVSSFQ
jgi:NRPS condensation-like uncharacterized protein